MADTAIEWAKEVWNPFTGCDRVSPGCAHCYAATQAASNQRRERGRMAKARAEGKPDPKTRYQNDGDAKSSGPGFGFTVHWDKIEKPQKFTKGARVFVNSMSDLFHEDAPVEAIAAVWQVFFENPETDFLVLTKRPERMREILCGWQAHEDADPALVALPNVWLGVTIENRKFTGRADILRTTPAAVRFISAEPLLGPLIGISDSELDLTGIDWVICGGESGPDHRPFNTNWAWDLLAACEDAGAAFFMKQLGGNRPGGELSDLPAEIRVRQFPSKWGGKA